MKIDGSCHCGAIQYEAEIDPGKVSLCHCTDCQVLSGSAFRMTVPAAEADFRLTAGQPKVYVKTAESGAQRVQAFCADCGSPIYATSVGPGPKTYGLRVGTIDQRQELSPARQIWRRSALPWVPEMDDLETHDGQT
jgi:hypothetical protein